MDKDAIIDDKFPEHLWCAFHNKMTLLTPHQKNLRGFLGIHFAYDWAAVFEERFLGPVRVEQD